MKTAPIWSSCFSALAIVAVHAEEPPLRWVRDLDEAKQIAAAEHKDLFVNYTGIEWCGHCIELESGVLSRKEFRAADADYVLVDLDLPNNRDDLGPLKERYDAWSKQYLMHSCPTVMLLDQTGRPYAYFTGYDNEVDVAQYLEQVTAARRARDTRDQALAAARQTTGAARAKKLHEAIQAVADALGTLEDREDDPVLTFYRDEVDDIRRIDADNALGLRKIYDARERARDDCRRRETVLAELKQFKTKEDCPAALAHIDKLLGEVDDELLRFQLKRRRYSNLEFMEQYADSHEALRGLLADPQCPPDDRDWMNRNQAILLRRMGRMDDALAFYDTQVAAAKDSQTRAYFLNWKANMLFGSGRHEETIATCRALRSTVKPKSTSWDEATWYLAFALQNAGQHQEAISVYRENLAHDQKLGRNVAHSLIPIARSQRALGQMDEARRTLDEVEKIASADAQRPAKQKELDGIRQALEKERELLAEKSQK